MSIAEEIREASWADRATWCRDTGCRHHALLRRAYLLAILLARAFRQATAAAARIATAATTPRYIQEPAAIPFSVPDVSFAAVVKDDSSDHSDHAP
jgi:hypothetical protein